MLVGLKSDGTYDIMKKGSDVYARRSRYKYCIFECSSYHKGPIHTLVKSKDKPQLAEVLKIELTLNFVNPEIGREAALESKKEIEEALAGADGIWDW